LQRRRRYRGRKGGGKNHPTSIEQMFDEGNWLVAEPFGHNNFDAFSVIDKEFLEPFLQP
jgi:hypothetical protein